MTVLEAVNKRLDEILIEKNISWYKLEKLSALSKGTIIGIQYCKNKSIDLKTLIIILKSIKFDINDFFNSPIFDENNLDCD